MFGIFQNEGVLFLSISQLKQAGARAGVCRGERALEGNVSKISFNCLGFLYRKLCVTIIINYYHVSVEKRGVLLPYQTLNINNLVS